MRIHVEIAPGELLDKLTILEIKEERISDTAKLENVRREKAALERALREHIEPSAAVEQLRAELKAVNERLWIIEDNIRERERDKDFGASYVELARSVYMTNDHRAALKRQINELLGSDIAEEKSYSEYRT